MPQGVKFWGNYEGRNEECTTPNASRNYRGDYPGKENPPSTHGASNGGRDAIENRADDALKGPARDTSRADAPPKDAFKFRTSKGTRELPARDTSRSDAPPKDAFKFRKT